MNQDNNIKTLVAGGRSGAVLGGWLLKDKEEGCTIGTILGAAFSATLNTNKEVQKTNQPVLVAENGKLYKYSPPGKRNSLKTATKWHKHFKLK